MRPPRWSIALVAAAAGLAGCGSSQPRSDAPAPTARAAAVKDSPPALTSLHAQANKLLTGGLSAFRARLASLHGYPVVVNKWASWCGPCQIEFPAFQDPHSNIAQAYRASTYFPQTLFFTRDGHGEYVFDHAGPYGSAAALEQDIRRYALR